MDVRACKTMNPGRAKIATSDEKIVKLGQSVLDYRLIKIREIAEVVKMLDEHICQNQDLDMRQLVVCFQHLKPF